jgi:hypothetical protein
LAEIQPSEERAMGRTSALLALATGSILAVAETWLNWGDWQPWPFFVVDYLAAAMLLLGGLRTLRQQSGGLRLLCGGWGFTAGMAWMAVALTWEQAGAGSDFTDTVTPTALLALIGALLGVSLLGLAMTVLHREKKG